MAQLQTKIENALNESRILVLGGQVLIGTAYQAVFRPGFDKLPRGVQETRIGALMLMLIGLGLLLVPTAYHQIEVLIEARLILPGAQALLGFQVASTLSDGFEALPPVAKWIHLLGLISNAVSTIFLMAPAASHRIALNGEDSEQFCRLASRFVIVAMLWLGLGVSGELFVVALKTTHSYGTSTTLAILILSFFYTAWFGYSYAKRGHASTLN